MWVCAGVIVGALGLLLITGSTLYLLPAIGCVLMMAAMMWLMMSLPGRRGRSDGS
jgi:hypothetical protein